MIMIVLNLKTYQDSFSKALLFCEIAHEVSSDSGVRIIVAPPMAYLHDGAIIHNDIFSQHSDSNESGAFTGSIPPAMLKDAGMKGSLVNHSEKRISNIKETLYELHKNGLESLLCAASIKEASDFSFLSPTMIAVEPPELIGSGISVSTANPKIVTDSVKAVKEINHSITVLCGAGISNKDDVKKSILLGSEGVLLASAFVRSRNPKEFLAELSSEF